MLSNPLQFMNFENSLRRCFSSLNQWSYSIQVRSSTLRRSSSTCQNDHQVVSDDTLRKQGTKSNFDISLRPIVLLKRRSQISPYNELLLYAHIDTGEDCTPSFPQLYSHEPRSVVPWKPGLDCDRL